MFQKDTMKSGRMLIFCKEVDNRFYVDKNRRKRCFIKKEESFMKSIRKKAIGILIALMAFLMLTACDGGTDAVTTWDTSRTKRYYESYGVTGQNISMQATMSTSGMQGVYFFTRNNEYAYIDASIAGQQVKLLADKEGYVYFNIDNEEYWAKSDPNTQFGQMSNIIWAGNQFIIPTAQNVMTVSSEKVSMNQKMYTAETIKININGTPANYTYYYGANGLEFVEGAIDGTNVGFEIKKMSGEPTKGYLKVPEKWVEWNS